MLTHRCLVTVAAGLALGGCLVQVGADEVRPAAGPTVVVTASYPGANARVVADTVAAPIEQQVNGALGMVWIASESRNDGSYLARVRFRPGDDPGIALLLVRNRVAIAAALLPEEVQRAGVAVNAGGPDRNDSLVTLALEDRAGHGHEALRRSAEAVVKRLAAGGVAVKLETFPGPDVKRTVVQLDRTKCARAGVAEAAVREAVHKAGPAATLDELKRVTLTTATRERVPLPAVAALVEVAGPAAIYRVNGHPAVRITGSPPPGKTAAEAAAVALSLAGGECPRGFAVEALTTRR